jgi:photosystem II stability/assembly factor-like uncharacterized protein
VVVASAQSWKVIQRDMEPVLMGISCLDNSTCFMAGGQDGTPPEGGPQVYKSVDSGATWKWLPHSGFAMMFLDVAASSKTNAVTAGIGLLDVMAGVEYTKDGQSFNVSHFLDLEDECQSTMTVQGVNGGFGLAGDFGKANGVAVSLDGGVTFAHIDAKLNTSARYGDYPSKSTWYVTAGTWPDQGTKAQRRSDRNNGVLKISQRLTLKRSWDQNGAMKHKMEFNTELTSKTNGPYTALIAKTSDGGRTWTQQYWNTDFYFNAISCPSENVCFAVGESLKDSPAPGCRILRTTDGGKTWKVVLYNADPSFSLIAMDMINEKEGWAGGGQMANPPNFQAHFYHTMDGGDTWTLEKLAYNYITDYSFIPNGPKYYKGYATAIDIDTLCSVLVRE